MSVWLVVMYCDWRTFFYQTSVMPGWRMLCLEITFCLNRYVNRNECHLLQDTLYGRTKPLYLSAPIQPATDCNTNHLCRYVNFSLCKDHLGLTVRDPGAIMWPCTAFFARIVQNMRNRASWPSKCFHPNCLEFRILSRTNLIFLYGCPAHLFFFL